MLGLGKYQLIGVAIALAVTIGWALLERNGRKDAELALLEQKNQQLSDANAAWTRVDKARGEFDEQVAKGLATLNEKQRQMETTIDDYRKAVAADPTGRILLSPAELAALRMLARPPPDQAGRNPVRGADQLAPVR